ncbi:MAG: hypothetical protein F4Z01_09640 [Gammaproteobacteria bacterium]|nr:hypothetical protein [Gammaproteobacteria bacterium]
MRSSALFSVARFGLGVLLIVGGVFGLLPVLGFWMLPLGVLLIATCIPYFDRRIRAWMKNPTKETQNNEQNEADTAPPERR